MKEEPFLKKIPFHPLVHFQHYNTLNKIYIWNVLTSSQQTQCKYYTNIKIFLRKHLHQYCNNFVCVHTMAISWLMPGSFQSLVAIAPQAVSQKFCPMLRYHSDISLLRQ